MSYLRVEKVEFLYIGFWEPLSFESTSLEMDVDGEVSGMIVHVGPTHEPLRAIIDRESRYHSYPLRIFTDEGCWSLPLARFMVVRDLNGTRICVAASKSYFARAPRPGFDEDLRLGLEERLRQGSR